jgi:hypothetical protein
MAASLLLSSMSDANSSLLGIGGTPIEATLLHHRSMRDTNSSLLCILGTSLVTATFMLLYCPVGNTNASLHDLVGTSLMAAPLFLFSLYASLDTRLGILDNQLFLEYRLFHPRRDNND